MSYDEQVECPGCRNVFGYGRPFSAHLNHSEVCSEAYYRGGVKGTSQTSSDGKDEKCFEKPPHEKQLPETKQEFQSSDDEDQQGNEQPQRSDDEDIFLPGNRYSSLSQHYLLSREIGSLSSAGNEDSSSDSKNSRSSSESNDGGNNLVDHEENMSLTDAGVNSDGYLLRQYQRYQDSGTANMNPNPAEKTHAHLLKIMKKANAPLYAFDEVMDWAHESVARYKYNHERIPSKRPEVLDYFSQRYDMKGLLPKIIPLQLPESGWNVEVVVHDFKDIVYSLLTDPTLMKDENLLFFGDSPFTCPPSRNNVFADVNTGTRYRDCYKKLVKDFARDVLCPLIFFADKTHTDEHGKLCLEPVMITLGIFNRETRNRPEAWRPLGYVTNQSIFTGSTSIQRARDYHAVMDVILKSLIHVQQSNGLAWKLQYKGIEHEVLFKFPVLFVIGDTEGHDKMCGKFQMRSNDKVKRLCRYCDCPTSSTGDPYCTFSYTKQREISQLVQNNNATGLKEMSQHLLSNAWYKLDYGGCPRGIHGSTPAESLHTIEKGLHEYAIEAILGQRKISKEKKPLVKAQSATFKMAPDPLNDRKPAGRKSNAKALARPRLSSNKRPLPAASGPSEKAESDAAKKNYFVFSKVVKDDLDRHAKILGKQLKHQSDRNLPRAYFPQGISSNTKINAHEEQGVLLLLLLTLCSDVRGRAMDKNMGSESCAKFIQLLESLMMFEEFVKKKAYTSKELQLAKEYIPHFLNFYSTAVNRTTGMGMNFVKFHLSVHLIDDIYRFGSPENFNSGPGESSHKENCKRPSKRTQRRVDTFEWQTANRYTENLIVERAYNEVFSRSKQDVRPIAQVQHETPIAGKRYFVDSSGSLKYTKGRTRDNPRWCSQEMQMRVCSLIFNEFLHKVSGDKIILFTEFKLCDQVIRACPDAYRGEQERRDWVYVDWGEEHGKVPAHLIVGVDLTGLKEGVDHQVQVDGSFSNGPGLYVIAETLEESLDAKEQHEEWGAISKYAGHQDSLLVFHACKSTQIPPANMCARKQMGAAHKRKKQELAITKLCLVPLEAIDSPCIAVCDESPDYSNAYLFVRPRSMWPEVFMDVMTHINDSLTSDEEDSD